MTKAELCAEFRALHRSGTPLILPNIWDAGSAKAVADAGAKALATSSWAVAATHGFSDGEALPLALVIANVDRIGTMSGIPVTVDFEGGYGESLGALEASFGLLFATCAVGCNLEDGEPRGAGIRSVQEQFGRIKAARELANASSPGFFINARTDLFLQAPSERHGDQELVSQAIERGRAYGKAGADGYFVPGLTSSSVIRTLVDAVELPINVMAGDEARDGYVEAGIARISFGPSTYLKATAALTNFAAGLLRASG